MQTSNLKRLTFEMGSERSRGGGFSVGDILTSVIFNQTDSWF